MSNSTKQLPTLRPSQRTWAVSPPIVYYRLHPPLPFSITQPKSLYSFLHLTEWALEGTAVSVCSRCL